MMDTKKRFALRGVTIPVAATPDTPTRRRAETAWPFVGNNTPLADIGGLGLPSPRMGPCVASVEEGSIVNSTNNQSLIESIGIRVPSATISHRTEMQEGTGYVQRMRESNVVEVHTAYDIRNRAGRRVDYVWRFYVPRYYARGCIGYDTLLRTSAATHIHSFFAEYGLDFVCDGQFGVWRGWSIATGGRRIGVWPRIGFVEDAVRLYDAIIRSIPVYLRTRAILVHLAVVIHYKLTETLREQGALTMATRGTCATRLDQIFMQYDHKLHAQPEDGIIEMPYFETEAYMREYLQSIAIHAATTGPGRLRMRGVDIGDAYERGLFNSTATSMEETREGVARVLEGRGTGT